MMWEHNKRTVVDVGTKQKTFVDAGTKKTLVDWHKELNKVVCWFPFAFDNVSF